MRRDSNLRLLVECLVKIIVLSTIFKKSLASSFASKPVLFLRAKSGYAIVLAIFCCFLFFFVFFSAFFCS